jgi:DNA repair photolyase
MVETVAGVVQSDETRVAKPAQVESGKSADMLPMPTQYLCNQCTQAERLLHSPAVIIPKGIFMTSQNAFVEIDTADSVAIPGCTYIYAPKGQAGEYAVLATNPYRGCGHGCKYCYVPAVIRMKRDEFNNQAAPRPDYLKYLLADARKYMAAGSKEQVMFSFTTDVYNPIDRSLTRPAIEILRNYGLAFCVLTKGGARALADIDLYRADRDAFASTLTSLDPDFSRRWEPNAAPPESRIKTLKAFHDAGIFTWVSLEPTLSVESSLEIVQETHSFVDLFKIGRANYLPMTATTDWRDYTLRMIDLCAKLNVRHYVKRDLQPYLPAGYKNPLRVPQHH